MSAPTALPENYVSCVNATFTIGTDPNTAVLKILQGGYTDSYNVDEMTNSGSGGCYEDVKTTRSIKGSFTAAYVSGTPPVFKAGDIFPATIANGTAPTLTVNFRFNNVQWPVMNVKEGLKFSFDVQSQGAITTLTE